MLHVYFTVDVEIWCDGWVDLDRKFSDAFQKYIYGATAQGEFGLRYQARVLRDHGLKGVFFVEPLFSGRFGFGPLSEVLNVLRDGAQEVQLHLHTEWLDEWPEPLFDGPRRKRQYMRDFAPDQQRQLVQEGVRRLRAAGQGSIRCFRAGSFGFNSATLDALSANGIPFDASYDAVQFGPDSGVAPQVMLNDVYCDRGVTEFPITVYDTGFGRLRHVQLGACSWSEIEHLLWAALHSGRSSFVILSHNFELLSPSKRQQDPIVVSRFRRLCKFLDSNRDCFRVCGFDDLETVAPAPWQRPLRSTALRSAGRMAEQALRRRYA